MESIADVFQDLYKYLSNLEIKIIYIYCEST